MTRHSVYHLFTFYLSWPTLLNSSFFFSQIDEDFEEIDPAAIIPQGRRTRGVRVDYTSEEALKKAGLQGHEDDESDDDVEMKD